MPSTFKQIIVVHLKKTFCLIIGHDWQVIDMIFGYGYRKGEYYVLECDRCGEREID